MFSDLVVRSSSSSYINPLSGYCRLDYDNNEKIRISRIFLIGAQGKLFPFYLRTRLYGLYKTAWKRLKNRQDEGIWDRIFKALAYPLESMECFL
jgi:hypothetical protein